MRPTAARRGPARLDQLAAQARQAGTGGAECGAALLAACPHATDMALALAMKHAGYPPLQTGAGLLAALPATTTGRLTTLLIQLYA